MSDEKPNKGALVGAGKAELGEGIMASHNPDRDYVEIEIKGQKARVSKLELYQYVFAICTEEQRDSLLPVRQTEVMHYEKLHKIMLKKDMKKGTIVYAKCVTSVPLTVVEGLSGLVEKEKGVKLAMA